MPLVRPFSVEEFMDTYRQCEELVEKGVIRYIGISNMTIPKLEAVLPLPEMKAIAEAHGVHPALIALKWAHQRGEISIPFSVHNFAFNLKCVTEDPLTEEEMQIISTLEKGSRLVKGQVFLWKGANDWHDLWDEDGVIVK